MFTMSKFAQMIRDSKNGKDIKAESVEVLIQLMEDKLVEEVSMLTYEDEELNEYDTVFSLLMAHDNYGKMLGDVIEVLIKENKKLANKINELENKEKCIKIDASNVIEIAKGN